MEREVMCLYFPRNGSMMTPEDCDKLLYFKQPFFKSPMQTDTLKKFTLKWMY